MDLRKTCQFTPTALKPVHRIITDNYRRGQLKREEADFLPLAPGSAIFFLKILQVLHRNQSATFSVALWPIHFSEWRRPICIWNDMQKKLHIENNENTTVVVAKCNISKQASATFPLNYSTASWWLQAIYENILVQLYWYSIHPTIHLLLNITYCW